MRLSDINPFIRYAGTTELRPVPFFTYSYDCRLLYLNFGKVRMYYGERVINIAEGSLLIWQSGVPYRFETEGQTEITILNFDFTQNFTDLAESLHVTRADLYDPARTLEHCRFEDCPELDELLVCERMHGVENDLTTIVREIRERKRFCVELSSALLKRILCDAARSALNGSGTGGTVDRVLDFIRENYSRPITNRDISESVNYHEYYVNRLMRRQTGMTLHSYLLNYRLRNSEKLLLSTDHSIAKIAELCGFTSCAYFISAFRHRSGETPSEYRRRRIGLI